MDEADLCDKVALMQNGNMLSINTPAAIINNFSNSLWAVKSPKMLQLLNELKATNFVADVYPFGEYHHVVMKDNLGERSLQQFIQSHHNEMIESKIVKPGIEDCFIALMKN
jgi:ABC-type multidrug transport system ATPase subunit